MASITQDTFFNTNVFAHMWNFAAAGNRTFPLLYSVHSRPVRHYYDMLTCRVDPLAPPGELMKRVPTPATRNIEIQTDYRDSEAQTDPYTPEYVVRPGSAPELLTLATLTYSKLTLLWCLTSQKFLGVKLLISYSVSEYVLRRIQYNDFISEYQLRSEAEFVRCVMLNVMFCFCIIY